MPPIFLAGALVLAGWGCARPTPETPAAVVSTVAVAEDGLCAEHGVLASVCPRCNPALAAVFQAKGDWCAEHGFPESFCPLCHPERGGRPAGDVTGDNAPADGLKIRFKTRETARMAGIETALVQASSADDGLVAVARVVYDATRVSVVSAPAAGTVDAVRADVGTRVRKGDPLAVLRSPFVTAERSQVEVARSRLTLAEGDLERKRSLLEQGVVSRREVLDAEQELAVARAEVAALDARLGAVGGGSAAGYTLAASMAGQVTRRDVSVGMTVSEGTPLFEVVDTTRMWAEVDVPEADASLITIDQIVRLRVDALPDRVFEGTVRYLAPEVHPATRTVLARVEIDNADGVLRANMYGEARIAVAGAGAAVVVPSAAVQHAGEVDLVFVRIAEDEFVTRRIRVTRRSGDTLAVTGGIQAGDSVATTGSFLLKTETLKDSIGAGCCDVE